MAAGIELLNACRHPFCNLFRLPRRLPEADIVDKFVGMAVDLLLSLAGTPDLHTVLHKPFHYIWCFTFNAAKAVEEEYQQDVNVPFFRFCFQLLNGVSFGCGYF